MPSSEKPSLTTRDIVDIYVRKNFEALRTYFSQQNQMLDFKFVELNFSTDVVEAKVRHGLNLIPRDLMRLEVTGPGKITFHRGKFTKDFLIVSSTDAVHARLFVGLYKGMGSDALNEDVIEEWKATV